MDILITCVLVIVVAILLWGGIRRGLSEPKAIPDVPKVEPKPLPLSGMEASVWRDMYSIDEDTGDRDADNGLFEAFVLGDQPRAVEKHFYLTLAGTTHSNDDGSSRIQAIRKCGPGDQLDLVPEPNNPYDPNAVAVFFEDMQLGYLEARLAGETVRDARRNGMRRLLYFRHADHHPTNGRTVGATAFMVLLEPLGTKDIPAE